MAENMFPINAVNVSRRKSSNISVILLMFTWTSLCIYGQSPVPFRDVSLEAGLNYSEGATLKYGGAAIADLNGDGCPDMLFNHHGGLPMELYFNQCNGSFVRSPFRQRRDVHALTPVRWSAWERSMHFVLTTGGGRGKHLDGSDVYRVMEDSSIIKVTDRIGFNGLAQRGRGALPTMLHPPRNDDLNSYTEIIITSAEIDGLNDSQVCLSSSPPGIVRQKFLSGDLQVPSMIYVAPVDVFSDGQVDVLELQPLTMLNASNPWTLDDVSFQVFPKWDGSSVKAGKLLGVSGVAEADFNNDGIWDLYLARSSTGDMSWRHRRPGEPDINDFLLFGSSNGTYEDVSVSAGIPENLESRGVTTGDFDNDGWIDILLLTYTGDDLFLMNNGNGTFRTVSAPWEKLGNATGDMGTAVDYDRDGRLDIILSEGEWFDTNLTGFFRVMHNDLDVSETGHNFMLVRVGSSETLRATSLHATAKLTLSDGKTLTRRVGAPGVVVSVSYIELLHFGIGDHDTVDSLVVSWFDGSQKEFLNVPANSYLEIGVF